MGDLANSFLIAYIALAILTKRPQILAVFLLCECLFLFYIDGAVEYKRYIVEFILWSYVFTSLQVRKNKLTCGIICLLSFILFLDGYYFGVGTHGEAETWFHVNIEYLALCAHIVFIGSFINPGRIINDMRHFINSIANIAVNGDCFIVIDYNKVIFQKALNKK